MRPHCRHLLNYDERGFWPTWELQALSVFVRFRVFSHLMSPLMSQDELMPVVMRSCRHYPTTYSSAGPTNDGNYQRLRTQTNTDQVKLTRYNSSTQNLLQQSNLEKNHVFHTWRRRMNWGNLWTGLTRSPKRGNLSLLISCLDCQKKRLITIRFECTLIFLPQLVRQNK